MSIKWTEHIWTHSYIIDIQKVAMWLVLLRNQTPISCVKVLYLVQPHALLTDTYVS